MVQGQSCQPKDLSSHQAGVFQRTQWELQLSIHPVNRATVWTVDSKVDLCPSTTLPNKVLKTVPSAQGPEKIHTTRVTGNKSTNCTRQQPNCPGQHDCDSRGNPTSQGKGKDLYLLKSVCKNWKRCLLLQMYRQRKATGSEKSGKYDKDD